MSSIKIYKSGPAIPCPAPGLEYICCVLIPELWLFYLTRLKVGSARSKFQGHIFSKQFLLSLWQNILLPYFSVKSIYMKLLWIRENLRIFFRNIYYFWKIKKYLSLPKSYKLFAYTNCKFLKILLSGYVCILFVLMMIPGSAVFLIFIFTY